MIGTWNYKEVIGQVAKKSRRKDAFSLTDFVGGALGLLWAAPWNEGRLKYKNAMEIQMEID